jgi:hypothetical protein
VKRLALIAIFIGVVACKVPSLVYQCTLDTQCSGSGGHCIESACAFPSSTCDSGLVFDASAGARAGQCVGIELAGNDMSIGGGDQDLALGDMASSGPPADLATHCVWHATNNLPEAATRIWASDASHLFAAGDNLSVSNTSGVGWSGKLLRDAGNLGVHAHSIFGFGSTVFIACSGFNVFMVDAAQNVTLDHPGGGVTSDLFGMWGASAADLWAIGDGAIPLHRAGTTWTMGAASVAGGNDMQSMHGTSASNIWAAGDFEVTHWDGANWTPQALNVGGFGITSIFVLDTQNIYLTQGSGNFYASHDGGATWGGGATGLTAGLSIFGFPGHLWVAGMGNSIAHSIDDGAHWTLEDSGIQAGQINQVWGRSPTELYAVGGTWWSICK